MNLRIFKDGELLLSQNVEFSSETAIKPIQVDDDAKIEYFEIDHTYQDRDRGGRHDPGIRQGQPQAHLPRQHPGQLPRRHLRPDPHGRRGQVRHRAAADDRTISTRSSSTRDWQAKREADKNFAAEVDKAIVKLAEKEKGWNVPNRCAEIKFDPVSDSLTLEEGRAGDSKRGSSRAAEARPTGAKWTLLERANATVTPPKALANPATFNYTVTKAGKGVEVAGGVPGRLPGRRRRRNLDPADQGGATAAPSAGRDLQRLDLRHLRLRRGRAGGGERNLRAVERRCPAEAGPAVRTTRGAGQLLLQIDFGLDRLQLRRHGQPVRRGRQRPDRSRRPGRPLERSQL